MKTPDLQAIHNFTDSFALTVSCLNVSPDFFFILTWIFSWNNTVHWSSSHWSLKKWKAYFEC